LKKSLEDSEFRDYGEEDMDDDEYYEEQEEIVKPKKIEFPFQKAQQPPSTETVTFEPNNQIIEKEPEKVSTLY
jgi:hypothetical protein